MSITPSRAKIPIPHHKIPRLYPLCPSCGAGTNAIMASPFAEGYHRRHRCKDITCDAAFYTLTPYYGGEAQLSHIPFKDRRLTQEEIEERRQWWAEEDEPLGKVPVTFTHKIQEAYQLPEDRRTDAQTFLVAACDTIKTELAKMEALSNGEDNGED